MGRPVPCGGAIGAQDVLQPVGARELEPLPIYRKSDMLDRYPERS